MKKTISIIILSVLVIPFIITSCKKGENDPFLSLKSRNARLVGDWKVAESTITSNSTDSYDGGSYTQNTTTVGTETINDLTYTETETETEIYTTTGGSPITTKTTTSGTGTITSKITYEKDGVFKMEETKTVNYTSSVEGQPGTSEWTRTTTSVNNGVWYWAGANEQIDTKNKEVLVMQTTSTFYSYSYTSTSYNYDGSETQTYEGNECPVMHFRVDQLNSDEMVIMEDDSYTSDGYNSTSSTIATLTKE